ncbi:MAG: WD40-repeat-containing domain protein, partial [Olpidium bornovanus]
ARVVDPGPQVASAFLAGERAGTHPKRKGQRRRPAHRAVLGRQRSRDAEQWFVGDFRVCEETAYGAVTQTDFTGRQGGSASLTPDKNLISAATKSRGDIIWAVILFNTHRTEARANDPAAGNVRQGCTSADTDAELEWDAVHVHDAAEDGSREPNQDTSGVADSRNTLVAESHAELKQALGTHLALGTASGSVQIWDVNRQRRVRKMSGHILRVGCLAWNNCILTTGSRDCTILQRDVRESRHFTMQLARHHGEVCGLKWGTGMLASGGNDDRLIVWDERQTQKPLWRIRAHSSAIRAIDWSPHQANILATGGGRSDR